MKNDANFDGPPIPPLFPVGNRMDRDALTVTTWRGASRRAFAERMLDPQRLKAVLDGIGKRKKSRTGRG
ncbi:MAG: hypothetical protein ACRED1_03710 [Limisphaerales bacterium]